MLIRILSDLHTEIHPYAVEPLDTDQDTILVLAGDCGLFKHVEYATFMNDLAPRFKKVLLVAGNHEWYSGKMHTERVKFLERITVDNLHVFHNDTVIIDGVLFIGGTMWTSFRNGNPMIMLEAQNGMNDYRKIRVAKNGYRRIQPLDVLDEHFKTRNFIFDTLKVERDKYEKIVVVTHHAPSRLSISPEYEGDKMNDMYVNDFEYWVEDVGPTLWVHGHIHSSKDYILGNTRVVCNPRGYAFTNKNGVRTNENREFDPTLLLSI